MRESERLHAALTAERAEAAAARNQLERAIRELADRKMRLARQMDEATRELEAIDLRMASLPDPSEKRDLVEAAEGAVEDAEAAIETVEAALARTRADGGADRARRSMPRAPGSTRWKRKRAPSRKCCRRVRPPVSSRRWRRS